MKLYIEHNFLKNRDINLYAARQYASAVELQKDLELLAQETYALEPCALPNKDDLGFMFETLSLIHERQARWLKKFENKDIMSGSFYFPKIIQEAGRGLNTRLCIQAISYLRGKFRYSELIREEKEGIWCDLFVDAHTTYMLTNNLIKMLYLEDTLCKVSLIEYNVMQQIDERRGRQ